MSCVRQSPAASIWGSSSAGVLAPRTYATNPLRWNKARQAARLTAGAFNNVHWRHARGISSVCVRAQAVAAPVENEKTYSAPQEAHGFELVRQQYVAEYNAMVLQYRHKKTGADVMSVVASDENKCFGVVLRTPVENSKGIPHILEHSVLCGSRKYPIKEPFVELMKGSLNTFLNAFTYPDRTCYPVASTNLQDFYNLVDVYMDAVFHPKCIEDKQILQQEGWHFELEDPKEPMTFKGVVYNEMKGVYSSPDSVNGRYTQQALFPDNSYAVDSGGDPVVIPELTFQEFKEFHTRYYHPSNARFWFYGDDPPEQRLKLLSAYLDEFDARPVDSTVHKQPLFNEPRRMSTAYAAGDGSEEEPKAFVSVNWLLSEDALDMETELAMNFLNYLLLGTSASPLRKALTDSGLGESLIGGGLEDELVQPIFSVGLKGVKPEDKDKVEALVLETLSRLEKEGFTATAIEAAVNTIEFSLRENNTGRFPRGLSLMLRAMGSWIYDRDPLRPLEWVKDLEHFKGRLQSGENVFAPLIRKYLLDNGHRVTLEMLPDKDLARQQEEDERKRLEAVQSAMDAAALEATIKDTQALKERQQTPDSPESLTCIPSLQLEDLPKNITTVPTDITSSNGATILTHDLFTNDVLYLEAALDMRRVPGDLLPLMPLFCRALTQMGTSKESFIELSERIGRKTGGISASAFVSSIKDSVDPVAYVMVRGKSMADKSSDMLDVMRDVLLDAKLDNQGRFKQMVLETKSALEGGLISAGHRFAASRLDAQRSIAGWASETMGGVSYLEYIRKLVQRVDNDWDSVLADLQSIKAALLSRNGAMVNMTADGRTLSIADDKVSEFLSSLPEQGGAVQDWGITLARRNEAIVVPTQVNYVGKAGNLYEDAGYQVHGSAYVIDKYLGTSWLWERVRVVGGAYGGFCDLDTHSGMFTYLSYRDPNLMKTVDTYDGTSDFLRGLELSRDELTKAIIGTIGDIDAYQLPDAKGYTAFMRHILGVADEERQIRREQILGTTTKDFHAFAEALDVIKNMGQVVAVTSAERVDAANHERDGFFQSTKRVL